MNRVIMSNLTKIKITVIDITLNNYISWTVGIKMKNVALRNHR